MSTHEETKREIEANLGLSAGTIQPGRSLLERMNAAENKRTSAPPAVGGFVPLPLPSRSRDIREWDQDRRQAKAQPGVEFLATRPNPAPPVDRNINAAGTPTDAAILRQLNLSSSDIYAYVDRRRALMTAQRGRESMTEQANAERMANQPSAGAWAGPLGSAKPTEAAMARPAVQGKPLCTMNADDKDVCDRLRLHKIKFGAGL